MRKLLFIILTLAGCLLFTEHNGSVRVSQSVNAAVFSAGGGQNEQWQCERTHNSDLNQPRLLREVESCPVSPSFRYGAQNFSERMLVRSVASNGCGTGVAKLTSTFRSSDLSVGVHAVDYYVYRLRRLII